MNIEQLKYKIVFVDVDGVLRDLISKMKEVFKRDFPQERIVREDDYDLTLWSTLKKDIFPWVFEGESAELIFTQAEPHHKSLEALKNWLDSANNYPKFFIVSHQAGFRIGWTESWLKKHRLWGKIPLFCTIDKLRVMRSVIAEESQKAGFEIPASQTILLDDNPRELKLALQAGIDALCVNQSWNQEWDAPRIKHLGEFKPFQYRGSKV